MRYSAQREAVYKALCSTKSHPDVAWLYNEVKKTMPHISLGTVYRNINELCNMGKARRIGSEGEVEHYDANTLSHPHFVCECCKKIIDIDPSLVEVKVNVQGANRTDVVVYGICQQCMQKNQK